MRLFTGLSVLTLGVASVDRSTRFYERLGWRRTRGASSGASNGDASGMPFSAWTACGASPSGASGTRSRVSAQSASKRSSSQMNCDKGSSRGSPVA